MGRRPLDIEKIALELIMSDDMATKKKLAKKIFDIAYKKGIYPSSIHQFYLARGKGEFGRFTPLETIGSQEKGKVFLTGFKSILDYMLHEIF